MKAQPHKRGIFLRAVAALILALSFTLSGAAAPPTPETPLDDPSVVVDEKVNEFVVTDGLIYWAYKCDGAGDEFREPGYLRRKPSHGGGIRTLEETEWATCWTFWWMNADASGVYYVNYETNSLDFRATDDTGTPVPLYTFSGVNDPVSRLELDEEYIYWASANDRIYRLPKTGGSATVIEGPVTGLRDLEQWGDQLYWLEDSGLWHCTKPDCPSPENASLHTGSMLSSWLLYLFWVEDTTPKTIRYRACFIGCEEGVFYEADDAGSWYINRPSVGECPDGNYCLLWEEYSNVVVNGRVRRKPLAGGDAVTLADNLLRGSNPVETDDLGVYFILENQYLGWLPYTASVVERDIYADAWEVTQGLQSLDNDIPLAANKTTYVRLYPRLYGTYANYIQAWLEGERDGTPLPGSPLEPLNGPFPLDEDWTYDRLNLNDGFLFLLPEEWTEPGEVTLRAVLDPRQIYADLHPPNNALEGVFTFANKPPVCDIFIPVRTHTPAASVEAPNFWRQIDLHRRLWPVPDVWVYYQESDIAEPQVCWWGPFPYPCAGPFELDEDASWDDWFKDDEEALTQIGARSAFSDDPDECDDLGSAVHYIGMIHPNAPWGWGGLAYTEDWLQPASLVYLPPHDADPPDTWNWPWAGSTLAHETSHNHERSHVDCGDPASPDGSFPYPTCELDDDTDPTHYGFDINARQPISPGVASDYMSYSPDDSEAPDWQGRWVSDYTYTAMFGRFSTLQELAPAGPPSPAAAQESVLISAIIDATGTNGKLNPTWVFPVTALSQGILEKWDALAGSPSNAGTQSTLADSYHVRLLDGAGTELADYDLTPMEVEIHADETRGLSFLQTFSAPAGAVTRLELMADDALLSSLEPGAAAPELSILLPAGGEVFTGSMTISWQASDPDAGDDLWFNVQYSPDGGVTWKAIATNLPAPLEGDISTLELYDLGGLGASDGASGLIQVAATDGYHTTVTVSEPFTVDDQPPQPYILSPGSTQVYPPTQSVALRGGALDPETGGLSGDSLDWSIDGQSFGSGEEADAYGLAPGTHVVTLEATDPAGKTASASAYLNIARLEIPQRTSAPTLDGLCDDPQYTGPALRLDPYSSDAGQATVRLVRTATDLWACFGALDNTIGFGNGSAGLRVDVDNSQDAQAQPDDYGFLVSEDGTPYTQAGDGSGGYTSDGPGGLQAQVSRSGDYWNAELRIDAGVLGGWDHPVGLELEHHPGLWPWRYNWPGPANYTKPDTWAWTVLGELPVISALSPGGAAAGGATFDLSISGEGFEDGAEAYWMTTALPTTYISSTLLTAQVDTALFSTAKYALITVRNPNTLTSNAVIFTVENPLPAISSLNPPGVVAGSGAISLQVNGSGFVDGAVVLLDGEALPTAFVSAGRLQVEVEASKLAYATHLGVTVQNPDPSGRLSERIDFYVHLRGRVLLPLVAR